MSEPGAEYLIRQQHADRDEWQAQRMRRLVNEVKLLVASVAPLVEPAAIVGALDEVTEWVKRGGAK